jgi:hypothetical protein
VCSHLHEDYTDVSRKIPFLKILIQPDSESNSFTKDAIVINHLEVEIQELDVCLDFNFITKLVTSIVTPNVMNAFGAATRFISTIQQDHVSRTFDMLVRKSEASSTEFIPHFMILLKALILHSVQIKIMLAIAIEKVLSC